MAAARPPFWYVDPIDRIDVNPAICNGRPVVHGTRMTAQTAVEFLSAGDSIDDVLQEYPALTREDVLACLAYSAKLLGHHFSVRASG